MPAKKLKPGPLRKHLKKRRRRPRVRLSRHKQRSVWFQSRSAWPAREAPVHILVRERNRTEQRPSADERIDWKCIGPTNVGGRMTSIVCHPKKPSQIWAGAAAGGVWQSKSAGRSWTPLWNDHDTLNIGSLAIDPKNPAVIYCGTGEANLSVDSYAGVGIYRTRNSGKTWKLFGGRFQDSHSDSHRCHRDRSVLIPGICSSVASGLTRPARDRKI